MSHFYRIGALIALSCLLSACASSVGVNTSKRTEHHYAFGKPAVPASTTVAPVVAQPMQRSPGLCALQPYCRGPGSGRWRCCGVRRPSACRADRAS